MSEKQKILDSVIKRILDNSFNGQSGINLTAYEEKILQDYLNLGNETMRQRKRRLLLPGADIGQTPVKWYATADYENENQKKDISLPSPGDK